MVKSTRAQEGSKAKKAKEKMRAASWKGDQVVAARSPSLVVKPTRAQAGSKRKKANDK